MLRNSSIILCLVIGLSTCFGLAPAFASAQSPNTLDRIVAIVNDGIITQSQVALKTTQTKQHLLAMGQTDINDASIAQEALQQLINQELVLQLAKQRHITVSAADISQAIEHIAAANHLTVKMLSEKLPAQGLTMEQFRKQIKQQIIVERVRSQVLGNKVTVTSADILHSQQQYRNSLQKYIQYHLVDILIPLEDHSTAAQILQAKKQARQLALQLHQGLALARVNQTQQDLGWRTLADLPDIYVEPVKGLQKVGDVTEEIHAPNGFHILVLSDIHTPDQALSPEQIKHMAWEEKANAKMDKWLLHLRKTAYIKINSN